MALYRSNGVPLLSRSDAPCAASFDSLDSMVKLNNKFTRPRLVAKNGTCLLKQIDVSILSFFYSLANKRFLFQKPQRRIGQLRCGKQYENDG
jgi:hypothetical protein